MDLGGEPRVDAACLRGWMLSALAARDVPAEHAEWVADGLIEPSLRGVDTHGVRLFPTYLAELDGGRAKARPVLGWRRRSSAAWRLDAGGALGLVAGRVAAEQTVELAKAHGVGLVVVRGSNHFGAASAYTLAMARRDVLAISMTNSDALVAPHGGSRPLFGTNPLSLAARGPGDEMFCLDMATSQVAYSRIKAHRAAGRPLEEGWAITADGRDAAEVDLAADEAVALRPLGGYKGHGLAMSVEILTAVLAGEPLDHELSHLFVEPWDTPRRVAHCFLALDIASLTDPEAFRARLGVLAAAVRAAPTPPGDGGEILVPGDLERRAEADRRARGIPLAEPERSCFAGLAARAGEAFP